MKSINGFLYWIPRILAILFILFLAFFSLDVFSPEKDLASIIFGLIMHNIPVFILIIVLVISWKYDIFGVSFMLFGFIFLSNLILRGKRVEYGHLTIIIPSILIGILFLFNWARKRQTPSIK